MLRKLDICISGKDYQDQEEKEEEEETSLIKSILLLVLLPYSGLQYLPQSFYRFLCYLAENIYLKFHHHGIPV